MVGAGIAGSTVAYFLGRSGMEVTVVERAGQQRSSGSPVDVRGPALAVVEQMDVLASIRAVATQATRLVAVDGTGRRIGWIPTQTGTDGIEVPRSALAGILASAGHEHAEFVYGDTVVALLQDEGGVAVSFERAATRRFDLVLGADGLHSTVRRLVFGPEELFLTHLGLYIATVDLDQLSADPSSYTTRPAEPPSSTRRPDAKAPPSSSVTRCFRQTKPEPSTCRSSCWPSPMPR